MKLTVSKDYFDGSPKPPRLFLCTPSGKIIGELNAHSISLHAKWNSYGEISFETPMVYTDMLTGETKTHPLYNKVESPRQIYVKNIGYFILQDIDDTSGENDIKKVTAFSAEYAVANKYLTSFYVNTGEIGSIEVTYNENLYGINYSTDRDSFYTLASGDYNPYKSYYIKEYTSTTDFVYQQTQVDAVKYAEYISKNNDNLAQPHEKLYIKKYANVQFYNPTEKGLSLLHLIMSYVPEWTIGEVDTSLWQRERSFSQDRVSVYDFLMNDIAETFGCVFEWDTLTKTLNVYEEEEDGIEEDNTIQTRWATDCFISKSNLASEVSVKYNADNIKTKLVVKGGEDLTISEVNLDRNSIMNLSFYHNLDWMEPDLYEAYSNYLAMLKEAETGLDSYGLPSAMFPMSHSEAVKKWVAAQNKYNDLMHEVPAENDTVLVGDEFKKLYCAYTPINTAFVKEIIQESAPIQEFTSLYSTPDCTTVVDTTKLSDGDMFIVQGFVYEYKNSKFKYVRNAATTTSLTALIKKLNLYRVDEDIKGNKTDNILLKLKNANSDTATIRIYDPKQKYEGNYNEDLQYYKREISPSGIVSYKALIISNQNEFNNEYAKGYVYINNYTIQCVVARADSGISDSPSYWSMSDWDTQDNITPKSFSDWIQGKLTADEMGLVKYDADGNKMLDGNGKAISDYTVSYIGTMGAYFVLAENEFIIENGNLVPSKDHLRQYGVNLLKEKHDIYTTIFQTQTEAMLSQEGYQCTVSDNAPTGDIAHGTRWLDTDSNPVQLKSYDKNSNSWVLVSASLSPEEQANYADYQRYIDNYQKLQAVQEVLAEKEREAEYCRDGHAVSDRKIDVDLYTRYVDDNKDGVIDDKDFLRYNGELLEGNLHRAAEAHFEELSKITGKKYTLTRRSLDQNLPLYTFTTSYDPIIYGLNTQVFNPNTQYYVKISTFAYKPVQIATQLDFETYDGSTDDKKLYVITSGHVYAVYLRGTTPYVAYMDSQGVYQMIRDYIREKTELNNVFNEDQRIRLSPFIREDEFNDSNFFWTDYDSEEQKIQVMEELVKAANKELNTLCQPSLEFSMTMANILTLPEFSSLVNQFQLGNFIRVEIRDGYIKRARLLEVDVNFDDLSDFSCTFGNLVTTKSEIDKHADLLAQAISAGKQVAVAAGTWQRSSDKVNKLEEAIESGLQDAALQIGRASGQAITWDESGFYCRKFVDGTTDQYEDEQIAIINNKIVFTNDAWKTSKSALGEFEVDINGDGILEKLHGLIAQAVISGYIKGSTIEGGSLKIGDGSNNYFYVAEDGSVEIMQGGAPKYATSQAVGEISEGRRFSTELVYSGSTVFSDPGSTCTITCKVYNWDVDITQDIINIGGTFSWIRNSVGINDAEWNASHRYKTTNTLVITNDDIARNSHFECEVNFDPDKLKKGES